MEPNEMRKHRLPLDSDTIDRLLGGQIDQHDAPPGYAAMAGLLSAAATPPASQEIDDQLLGSMVHAITATPRPSLDRKPSMISKLLTAKVAAVGAALVLSTTGAAAAATGNLPAPAQDAVSEVVSHVGVDLPAADADDATPSTDDDPTRREDHPTGREDHPTGHADNPTGHADNPTDADQHGADVSAVARDPELTGAEKGAAVSAVARDGHGPDGTTTTTVVDEDTTESGRPADPGSQARNGRAPAHATAGSGNADGHDTADDDPGVSGRP